MADKKKSSPKTNTMADYAQAPAPATASRSAKPGGKKVLTSVRIEVAKNGFSVSCSYSGPNGEYLSLGPTEQKPMVFNRAADALEHVEELMGVEERDDAKKAKKTAA